MTWLVFVAVVVTSTACYEYPDYTIPLPTEGDCQQVMRQIVRDWVVGLERGPTPECTEVRPVRGNIDCQELWGGGT